MTTLSLETLDDTARALLFTEARTANTFTDEPVTDEELSSIWDLARFAPTMANSQPLRVLFVRTAEGKERLAPFMSEGNRDKTLTAPAVAILAYDTAFHEHFPTVFPARGEMYKENFGGMPAEVVADLSKYSAALASGVFFLAVRAHGLAAGPMAGYDGPGIDAEFLVGTTWKTHLVVNIGHPGTDAWFDRLPRMPRDEVVHWA